MKSNFKDLEDQIQELFQTQKYEKILDRLDDATLDLFDEANLYAWKARAFGRLNKPDLMYKYAQLAIDKNPVAPLGYLVRGNAKANQEDYKLAIEDFDKSISLNNNYGDALVSRGYANYFLKNYEQSLDDLRLALKIAPNNTDALLKIALCLKKLGRYDDSIKALNKAISVSKDDANLYAKRGLVWFEKRNYARAISDYNKSLSLKPNVSSVFNNRGVVYSFKKQFQKALIDYSESLLLNPTSLIVNQNRAITNEALKHFDDALKDYEKILELRKGGDNEESAVILKKIEQLTKKIEDFWYDDTDNLVNQVKKLLCFENEFLTHFTSLSNTKAMILDASPFRLSEGNFLNDTSEGRELFKFLSFTTAKTINEDAVSTLYVERPFIGSFVAESKHDDLTLWRMYGKENQTEATGCAITINRTLFIKNLENKFNDSVDEISSQSQLKFCFYKVAYREGDVFTIPDSLASQQKKLNTVMHQLKKILSKLTYDQRLSVTGLLNDIAYLFKSSNYLHENEVRLVVPGVGFTKQIVKEMIPPKVFIELISLLPAVHKMTLGPKVERPDEWAAAFNYSFYQQLPFSTNKIEIIISHLPFK
jgi:tetratricopeptide (TPR) repeat protein